MVTVTGRIQFILDHEVSFTFALSGGPGGQNVNKVATKAVLKWDFASSPLLSEAWKARFAERFRTSISKSGELVLASDSLRSQLQNKEACLEKLREMLQSTSRAPKARIATKVPKAAKRRRVADKKQHSEKKNSRRKFKGGDE